MAFLFLTIVYFTPKPFFMFSHKFIIRPDKKNALMLRIVNNRKKAEIACGFHLEAADLDDALSPSPSRKNVRMSALLAMWQGKIASLKLELAVEGLTAMDVKELKARLLLLL
ncbi:MAG: hypothetical protein K2H03_04720, partial [Muribaculaceae bacterium]|nr:hypothetical protein [Muribaculaceae bacterium]